MRALFLFLSLNISAGLASAGSEFTGNSIPAEKFAKDPQWLNLIYYKRTFFGDWESQIDAKDFFLAVDGKTNPENELRANIAAFFRSDEMGAKEETSVLCRFPARFTWLKKKAKAEGLKISWPERECPRFQRWFEALRGTSVSLVFSSYFLNNPSSTFGHTLLRINKAPEKDGKRYELLDYGVNFAANANTSNPVLYSFYGLFGGFHGTFTTVPYYYKVREYSNSESRDLWEYELNIGQEATDLLVMHVWEVGPAYADYWYLSENCSYFMLALIEAADPKIDLTSRLKKYVIPTDTVQVVYDTPGLVKSFHYRPSVRSELFERLRGLDEHEKNVLSHLIEERSFGADFNQLQSSRQKLVLDAAIDDMDYRYPLAVQIQNSLEWKYKNQILAARSQINEITETLVVLTPERDAPHAGHGSRRVGLGYLSQREQGGVDLFNYRFAFHDILDPTTGFPEYAQIVFFDLKFGYEERPKKIELEEFNLFEVLSLSPYSKFSKSLSWRLKVAVEKISNEQCGGSCHAGAITGGAGYSLQFSGGEKSVGYLGIRAGVYYTGRDQQDLGLPRWLLGAGPNLIYKIIWTEKYVTSLEAWFRKDMHVSYNEFKEVSLSHQWSLNKNNGIRVTGVERWFEESASLEFFHYY